MIIRKEYPPPEYEYAALLPRLPLPWFLRRYKVEAQDCPNSGPARDHYGFFRLYGYSRPRLRCPFCGVKRKRGAS